MVSSPCELIAGCSLFIVLGAGLSGKVDEGGVAAPPSLAKFDVPYRTPLAGGPTCVTILLARSQSKLRFRVGR